MTDSALAAAKRAWDRMYEGLTQAETDRRVLSFTSLVRGIAETGSVNPDEFARENQLDSKQASDLFASFAAMGFEFDADGKIVGAALTTRQTPHSVALEDKQLFAWCALDTLFIPGLLGETAEIESTCPVSITKIRLTVAPDGVTALEPAEAVISIVLPGSGFQGTTTGPTSPT